MLSRKDHKYFCYWASSNHRISLLDESWHLFFVILGNQLSISLLFFPKDFKDISWVFINSSTRDGRKNEDKKGKTRNETQYFAFISHICFLLYSRTRRGTSNSFSPTIASKSAEFTPICRLYGASIDKTETKMSFNLVTKFCLDHSSRFQLILWKYKIFFVQLHPICFSSNKLSNKDVFYVTYVERASKKDRKRNRPQLFFEKFFKLATERQLMSP